MRFAGSKSYAQVEVEQEELHALLSELNALDRRGEGLPLSLRKLREVLQAALLMAPFGGGHDPK